jgi:predicted DNA binding CopG/RHH family protein
MNSSRKKRRFHQSLDAEEQEIEDALPESWNELPMTDNLEEEVAFAKEAAANYLRKDAKINIRLSHVDVERARRIAARKGLPYQTFIASIIHEYVASHL